MELNPSGNPKKEAIKIENTSPTLLDIIYLIKA